MNKSAVTATELWRVIGNNVRRIRTQHALTLDLVTAEMRAEGLRYGIARVSDLEAGRVEPKVESVAKWAQALATATQSPVSLADLFEGHPPHSHVQGGTPFMPKSKCTDPFLTAGAPERYAARVLGVSVKELIEMAVNAWGVNLTAERNRRAKPGATTADLGMVTTDLINELFSRRQDPL